MVEHVQERPGKCCYRNDTVSIRSPQKTESEPDPEDAHVFDTGVGKKPFQVPLRHGKKDPAERPGQTQYQQDPTQCLKGCLILCIRHPQDPVEPQIDHGAGHHRGDRSRCRRVCFRQPHMEQGEPDLQPETDQTSDHGPHCPDPAAAENEGGNQECRPRMTRQQVDPGGAQGGFFMIFKGNERKTHHAHQFPCHQKLHGCAGEGHPDHGAQRPEEEQPEPAGPAFCVSGKIALRMNERGDTRNKDRQQEHGGKSVHREAQRARFHGFCRKESAKLRQCPGKTGHTGEQSGDHAGNRCCGIPFSAKGRCQPAKQKKRRCNQNQFQFSSPVL